MLIPLNPFLYIWDSTNEETSPLSVSCYVVIIVVVVRCYYYCYCVPWPPPSLQHYNHNIHPILIASIFSFTLISKSIIISFPPSIYSQTLFFMNLEKTYIWTWYHSTLGQSLLSSFFCIIWRYLLFIYFVAFINGDFGHWSIYWSSCFPIFVIEGLLLTIGLYPYLCITNLIWNWIRSECVCLSEQCDEWQF